MMKISPDNIARADLIEKALRLQEAGGSPTAASTKVTEEEEEEDKLIHEVKELKLSEQMEVSLRLAQHLRDLANQESAREFFFVRFKRQLFKKNLIDRVEH